VTDTALDLDDWAISEVVATRERGRLPAQLLDGLLAVVRVEVDVAGGPNKPARLEADQMSDDVTKKCVRCKIKRNA
jgi:hypothetical protein